MSKTYQVSVLYGFLNGSLLDGHDAADLSYLFLGQRCPLAAIDRVLSLGYNNLKGAGLRWAVLQSSHVLCLFLVLRLKDGVCLLKEMPGPKIDVNQFGQLLHTLLIG